MGVADAVRGGVAPFRRRAACWRREPALLVLGLGLVLAAAVPAATLSSAGAPLAVRVAAVVLTVPLVALALAAFSPRPGPERRHLPHLAALAAACYLPVAFLGLPWADAAAVLPAALLTVPCRWRILLMALLAAGHGTLSVLVGRATGVNPLRDPARFLTTVALLLALAWLVGLWRARERRHSRAVLDAIRSERLRIARDVHDVLAQGLTAISLKAGLARRHHELEGDTHLQRELDEICALGSRTGTDLHTVISGWRSPSLRCEVERGVAALAAVGVACEVRLAEAALRADVTETLAWVAGEALTNVLRHSEAWVCVVESHVSASGVTLLVRNDGLAARAARGPSATTADGRGFGLAGIAERLALHGGYLVTTATGDTWEVDAWLPFGQAEVGTEPTIQGRVGG